MAAFAVAIVSGAFCLVHYYQSFRATEAVRVEAADFMREKAALLGRMAELEASVSRTERFAAKIESAVGKRDDSLTGLGPVEEDDGLPSVERTPGADVSKLGGGIWKSPFSKSLSAGLNLSINNLVNRSDKAEARVHTVFALKQDKAYFWASLPSIWPAQGWVTSEFGVRRGWGGRSRIHEGIDIAAPVGTPIKAPGDGIVTFTGYDRGYGQTVRIDHGYGITTVYAHCSSFYVTEGQRVKRGMMIAAIGNTGRSTGPHLHYEVRVDGVPVNPMLYVMR
ncbi:MAG TPA: M23 family metallopeptidase [bacterium]|nr:M23 family metallopeptidase [bacterium]